MAASHGQAAAKNRSAGRLVTMLTTRPMNQGTALSPSATKHSTTNKAANSHFAWRAKCHRKASRRPGGSGRSGGAVGLRIRSKRANICGWLQAAWRRRQSAGGTMRGAPVSLPVRRAWRHGSGPDLLASERSCQTCGGRTNTARRSGARRRVGRAMRRIIGALAALAASTVLAFAHDFPSRPITMIIGIGNWSSHVGAPALYALDYDSVKDLQPISLLAASPLWILGKASLPPNTAAELISWVKSTTAPATCGTVGTGSAAQLCGIYFQQKTAANLQFVPYRGAGPAIQDLLAGQIDLACLEATSTLPYVTAGKMTAFAILNEQRWPPSPNTPTMIESGVPGLSISCWHAPGTPKGTPNPVVARLVAAVQAALADPASRQHLEQLGQVIFPREQQNPEALAAYHKAEIDKWWPIIKAADIKTE